jgi:DNA-binding MarR family transcriptional regulator
MVDDTIGCSWYSAMNKVLRRSSSSKKVAMQDGHEGPLATQLPLGWSFGYVFREANRAFSDTFREQLKPYGITLGQWFFLRELWDEEGLSQRELSHRVGVREPTTAAALEIMVKRKLIVRRKRQGDHRSQFVHLTPNGRSLRKEVLALAIKLNERAVRGFSDADVKDLREKIMKMISNLGLPRPEPGMR